jgi:hypothetical protein
VNFESYLLQKVAPLLLSTAQPISTFDIEHDRMTIAAAVSSTLGMTLEEAVERLGIRPLAFGAAWKVIDLLLEHALDAAGFQASAGRRWTISEKVQHALQGDGRAVPLSNHPDIWRRLLASYAATEEVRHSLVHRRATVGTSGELTGTDRQGQPLGPVSEEEQIAFMRAAQRAIASMQQVTLSARDQAAFLGDLDQLARLTGHPKTGADVIEHPPSLVRVPVSHGQEIDADQLKRSLRQRLPSGEVDVLFSIGDDSYHVWLERIPDGRVLVRPDASWLS